MSVSDQQAISPQPQPDLSTVIRPIQNMLLTKATTAIGAALVTYAGVSDGQGVQIAGALVGVGMLIVSVIASRMKDVFQAKQTVAAAATGNPSINPRSPAAQYAVAAAIANPVSPITAKDKP